MILAIVMMTMFNHEVAQDYDDDNIDDAMDCDEVTVNEAT